MDLDRRYTARAWPGGQYCVWDHSLNAVAMPPDNREYADLSLDQALDLARELNEREKRT